jgi:hypothetical protein
MLEKPERKSKKDNPKTRATVGIRHKIKTKIKKHTIQKTKTMSNMNYPPPPRKK